MIDLLKRCREHLVALSLYSNGRNGEYCHECGNHKDAGHSNSCYFYSLLSDLDKAIEGMKVEQK